MTYHMLRPLSLLAVWPSLAFAQGTNTGTLTIGGQFAIVPPCTGGVIPNTNFTVTSGTAQTVFYNAATCAQKLYITCSPSNLNMPRIVISGGPGNFPLEISLGFGINQSGGDPTPVGHNWGGLDAMGTGGISQFYGGIGGNLVGNVAAKEIFRFDADGQINAGVSANNAGNSGVFLLFTVVLSVLGPL